MTLSTIADAGQTAVNDSVAAITQQVNSVISNGSLPSFTSDVFPGDLGSSYYNHYMIITALAPTTIAGVYTGFAGSVPRTPVYSAGLFMAGGAGGGNPGMIFEDRHKFAEIRMSNVLFGFLGGLTNTPNIGGVVNGVASLTGHPLNPGVEVLYQSTDLRTFQFDFLLGPRNPTETSTLQNMIKNLRAWAAPDSNTATGGWLFDSPLEWDISFFHNGVQNTNIPMIRRSVVTYINANYTPTGDWSTFSNGYPVSCLLTICFQEMEINRRDFILSGY